jgi:TolA-binding protein
MPFSASIRRASIPKAPNSLLKIGYSYYELKQNDEAKKVLQDLIQRYPGTTAAQDAEKRLQR